MHPIIQITTSSGWGGRESLPLTLHRAWQSRGVECTLLAGADTELAHRCQDIPGTKTIPTGRLAGARALRRALAALSSGQPVSIISHFTRDLGSIRLAGLGYPHIRLTVIKHVSPGPPKHDPLHRYLYRRVDRLLAVSEYVRRKCERTYPIDPARTGVWHPGVDTTRFNFDPDSRARLRAEAGVNDATIVLGYVARITPNKGLEDLIAAVDRLRKNGAPAALWLVGSASGDEQAYEMTLRQMAAESGAVRFWGRCEDVESFYSAFDIFVVPSRTEAFGLTTIEAMATARPVAGFNSGGTADIVEDGITGVLADAESGDHPGALAQAIQTLISSPERVTIGERARAVAVERFSLDAMRARLESLLG